MMANFLYNDVELPALPEWDKETYPYAYILYNDHSGEYSFECSTTPMSFNNGWIIWGTRVVYYFRNGIWEFAYITANNGSGLQIIWCNQNVLWPSGDVAYAASNPIRVDSKLLLAVTETMPAYNGVALPELPDSSVWDRDAYPYAVILQANYATLLVTVSLPLEYGTHYFDMGDGTAEYLTVLSSYAPPGVTGYEIGYAAVGNTWIKLGEETWSDDVYLGYTDYAQEMPVWTNTNIPNTDTGGIYFAKSEPVPCLAAAFYWQELESSDSLYKVAAWLYPKGTHYLDAPYTHTSFMNYSGAIHSENWALPELAPGTEYELYACIMVNDEPSDHNALITFTTEGEPEKPDFSDTILYISDPEYTETTAEFDIGWMNLPMVPYPNHVQYFISADLNDGSNRTTYLFSSTAPEDGEHGFSFKDLTPGTKYTMIVRLLYNTTGTFSDFTDSGVSITYRFTTLGGGFDRDSFLLGLASGLGTTGATKDDAEYNTWTQGYIVGSALRMALAGSSAPDVPDTEVWAEALDGVLHIHRAYNAKQNGDTLEVT